MPVAEVVEYERIWVEGLNSGDVSAADRAFTPECTIHMTGVPQPVEGIGAWKELVQGLLTAFPDLHFTIEDQIEDGDRVALRWRATGTQRGPFGPVPATNRPIEIDGIIFDLLENGKVRERWEQWDQAVMLQQLGVG